MKAYIEVYGCTANKSDASIIRSILKQNHFEITDEINKSDIVIILTCTVIDTTEQKMLSRIKKLDKNGKQIIVSGCMASVQKEKIKKIVPNAFFLPPQHLNRIMFLLGKKNTDTLNNFKSQLLGKYNDITAPISIAEGCSFNCSYCITRVARGKLNSYSSKNIINNIKEAAKQGCKEIQLTAQDTGQYGIEKNSNLGELLRQIHCINDKIRIRVGMMNPSSVLKNLNFIVEGYSDEKIYKFLHLPVQSGNNIILKKMNRTYNTDDFIYIVNKFRDSYPDLTLSTDIIVGFPGETCEQFQDTVTLIKKIKPDITNITRFSPRPFTKAKKMENKVKTEISKERSKKLTDICRKISIEQNKKFVGKQFEVLITEKGKNNTMIARAANYKTVVISEAIDIGEFINIKITDYFPTYLVASLK